MLVLPIVINAQCYSSVRLRNLCHFRIFLVANVSFKISNVAICICFELS